MSQKMNRALHEAETLADASSRGGDAASHQAQARTNDSDSKRGSAINGSATRSAARTPELLTFTIDPSTAQVVRLESLDVAGVRRELSDAERAQLAHRPGERSLEHVVERAFEAGIACILEGKCGPDDPFESLEDAELARGLLIPLIARSSVKDLISRDALNRAILTTLIEHAVMSSTTPGTRPEAGR